MKPQEFEKIVRAKTPVVESAPEPVVATTPAPVLEAMDLDSINQQYHALLGESSLHEFAPGENGGGTEAYTMEDEELDGMALGELQAIAQAAKKIYRSVKQGVPLEAWMYKKITNGNEGLTAVAQQINNPAVREQPGVAEGSLEELANTSLKVKEPKDMYNVNDRKQTTYKLFKFKSGKNTFLINFTVKSPPTYGKKSNWNAVIVSFGVKEKQHDYSFGDEMNTDLTGKNKNQFLIYSTVINTIRRFITEYNTEIDEIIMQGAGERQEAMYQRFFQSAGKYFPGWHYDGKHSLVRDVPRQKVKKVREQGVAEGSDEGKTGKNFAKIAPTLKPLTDEQILEIDDGLATWMFPVDTRVTDRELAFARAIEAAHGIKEQDMTPQIRMKGNVPGDKIKEQGVAEGSDQPVGYIDDEGKLVTIGHKPGFAKSVGHANGGWIDTGRAIPDSWKAVYTKNLEQGVAEGNVEKTTTGLKHTRDYEYPTKGREFNKDLDRLNKTQTGILDKALGVEWTPTNKRKEITGDQTGVAENFEPGETKRVLKSGGKPAGEIGLDPEASPGNGAYYIKHYASGKDLGGYDTYQEALEELRYIDKQYQHANRPADTRSKHQKMMDNPAYAEGYRDGKRGVTGKNVADIFGPMSDVYHQGYKAGKQGVTEGLTEIKKGQKDSNGYTKCWPGKHAEGTKKGKNGGQVRNCVPNESVEQDPNDPQWSKKYNKDVGESTTKIPTGLKHHGDYGSKYPPEEYRDEYGHRVRGQKYVPGHEENEYDHRGRPPKAPLAKVELPADAFGRVSGKVPKGKQGIRISGKSNTDESTDYASAVNNLLNEFAGGMGAGGVASAPGIMTNPAKTGSLFGGSYSQKNSPFKKKATKKESVIKR